MELVKFSGKKKLFFSEGKTHEESRIENFTFFPIKRSGSGRLFLDGGGDPVQDLIKIFFVKLGLGNVVDSPGPQHSLNVFKFRVDRQDHIVEVGIEL